MTAGNTAKNAANAVVHVPADVVTSAAQELANVIDLARDVVTTAATGADTTADGLLDQLSGHFAQADQIIAELLHVAQTGSPSNGGTSTGTAPAAQT